jgi:Mn-dependent DtxR family transcriptional regulator
MELNSLAESILKYITNSNVSDGVELKNIAKAMRVSLPTVYKYIKILVENELIEKEYMICKGGTTGDRRRVVKVYKL